MPKLKVIGWSHNCFFTDCPNYDEEHYNALHEDIDAHGYVFYGDQIMLVPVFSDYTFMSFSARGWGGIMSPGNYMDFYCSADDDAYPVDDTVLPKEGPYDDKPLYLKVDPKTFADLKNYVADYYREGNPDMGKYNNVTYLLPIANDGENEYWFGKTLNVIDQETDESIEVHIMDIKNVYDKEGFEDVVDEFQSDRNQFFQSQFPNLVVYDKTLPERIEEGQRLTLLVFDPDYR